MENFTEGLRCQDVHSGLRNVDPNSPTLVPLSDTRLVGMAASLAGLIRGRDVITDAQALLMIAADQLDVNPLAFNQVVGLLADAGFVNGIKQAGTKITTFTENVPFYEDLYETLGDAWHDAGPTELEQQLLRLVDGLSTGPVDRDSIESAFSLDHGAVDPLLEVGTSAGLVRTMSTIDGDIAYSPFFGFEQPQLLADLVNGHGSDRLAEEFAAVRARQGLPINPSTYPLLTQAVASGLVLAPSVEVPGGGHQAFAALPYIPDQKLLTVQKPVLDKALAVVACLRCAEDFGGYSSLSMSGLINAIDKLLDPYRGFLYPHSSSERQYRLMRNAGLVAYDADTMPGGSWVTPRFIDTEDNRLALGLARDMLTHGEFVEQRIDDSTARAALQAGTAYSAPMQTTHRLRKSVAPSPKEFSKLFEAAMSRGAR